MPRALGALAIIGTDYFSNMMTFNGERTNHIAASTTREIMNLKNVPTHFKLAKAVLDFSMVDWADAMRESNDQLERIMVVVTDRDRVTTHSEDYGATVREHGMSFVEVRGRHDTLLTHPQRLFEEMDTKLFEQVA